MDINPRFRLRDPKSETLTSIRLILYYNKKRFVYGTGLKIQPELWNPDPEVERPITNKAIISKFSKRDPNIYGKLQNIRAKLDLIRDEVDQSFNYVFRNKVLTQNQLREYLDQKCNIESKENKKRKIELNEYINRFIDDIESGARLIDSGKSKGQRYRKSTVRVYKTWKNQFLLFQEKRRYRFDQIDMDWYDRYVKFFVKKKYSTNTIGKEIKMLKVIMRLAYDEGLHDNREFDRKKFKTLKADTDSIYLTKEEIKRIHDLDLTNNPKFEKHRDVFLCGCYTGLRYSDYSRLSPEHFKKNGDTFILDLYTQKTNERVIIPVMPQLRAILEKYDYKLPKTWEQKLNDDIKDIGEKAGIKTPTIVEKSIGGLIKKTTVPKHKLIVTHTARRSACTNMYLAGVPIIDIMKISGHRTPKSFMKYIKVGKEETASKLAMHPYFKDSNLKAII